MAVLRNMENKSYIIGCDFGVNGDENCIVISECHPNGEVSVTSMLIGEEANIFYNKYLKRYRVYS